MVADNYLAPWLLTHLLLPSLQNAEQARIINVASEAKHFNIMFTGEMSRRLDGTSITVYAFNPGFNVTGWDVS